MSEDKSADEAQQAAAKIQAGFRGYRVRKRLQEEKAAAAAGKKEEVDQQQSEDDDRHLEMVWFFCFFEFDERFLPQNFRIPKIKRRSFFLRERV